MLERLLRHGGPSGAIAAAVVFAALLAGLASAPAFGAVERTSHASDCPVPLHAKIVQLGLAQVLATPVTSVPGAPANAVPLAPAGDVRAPAASRASSVRARAPPEPSLT